MLSFVGSSLDNILETVQTYGSIPILCSKHSKPLLNKALNRVLCRRLGCTPQIILLGIYKKRLSYLQ